MANFTWASPGSWTNGFGATDLNSLANGSTAHSSLSAIDTTTSRELYVQCQFSGNTISPTGPADVVVYFLPISADNTTYVDGDATVTIANQPIWMQLPHTIMGLRAKASSTQLVITNPIILPPGKYKMGLYNRAGVTLAAGNNMVKYRLLTQAVG